MFVYTQAARECCLELRSQHRILLVGADDALRWVGPGQGGGGHSPALGPQVLPVCLLEKYERACDGPSQP